MRRHWPQVRGGLLALAIALSLIDGCPIPPEKVARPWQLMFVKVIKPVQTLLLTPFTWITRWSRTHQRWALFQAVGSKQWRFEVQGRVATPAGVDWVTVYKANDDGYQDEADLLEYRKLRAVWNPTDAMSGYTKFANWYMGHVLERHPEFLGVRLRIQKVTLWHGEVTDTGEFDHYQSRERGTPTLSKPPAPHVPGAPRPSPPPVLPLPFTRPIPVMRPPDAGSPPDARTAVDVAPSGAAP